ncbi:MAG: efflux RND transporter periplasmic adaptor subunit [Anaeromyxobacter sp.]
MKTKSKIRLLVAVGLLVVVLFLVGTKALQIGSMIKAGESFVIPPEAVSSSPVTAERWAGTRSAIGSLTAVRGVTLGSEVAGIVKDISFESGSAVHKGAVLVRLDSSAEEAQLDAARADATLAKVNLDRAKQLREANTNSQADLDAAEARAKAAAAQVAQLEAMIAKKVIRAPFDGKISIRQVELGQVLSSGTPVASLLSVSPIYADFWLPQQALADLKAGQKVRLRTDAYPDANWDGEVSTVNPEVNAQTRNVLVRATIPNADGRLRPGMYANVEIVSSTIRDVMVVPATSVLYAPFGDSVFTIETKQEEAKNVPGQPPEPPKGALVARQVFVRLGERRGDFVEVLSGVKPGQKVVSAGAFKLKNGVAVAVNDTAPLKPSLTPAASDQ